MEFLLSVITILAAGVGMLFGLARRSLPQIRGQIKLTGLQQPVDVYRDERGVPHIEARTAHDLYRAQGFVTAQDRLWQMDMMRRLASGRLSEVAGEEMVQTDKLFRTFQLRRAALKSVAEYSPESRAKMEQYCAGVNAYIEQTQRGKRLPFEFALLKYQPEPWTVEDMLAVGKLMSFNMGTNYRHEVYLYELRKTVEAELFQLLRPHYPEQAYVTIQQGEHAGSLPDPVDRAQLPDSTNVQLDALLDMIYGSGDSAVGSNGWAVAGSRTRSGKPLLANDPHIEATNPATWYQTHLILRGTEEDVNVTGVIVPGLPGVLLGHNEHCAWGVVNATTDAQDLVIERRNPDNPRQFFYEGAWEDATVYEEVIKVKGREDVRFDLVVTRNGPILSDCLDLTQHEAEEVLALRWSALLPSTEVEAVFRYNRARNWEEFREGLRQFQSPSLNFTFACVDGTIAMKTVGTLPIRSAGDGTFPLPGWDRRADWQGYIPYDELPEIVNPESGFIATANNKIIDDSYPYLLTKTWNIPYRAGRLAEVLGSRRDFTVEDMRDLQVDYENPEARTLLPILLPHLEGVQWSEKEREALRLLQGWDCRDEADSGGSFVFQLLWEQIAIHLFQAKMGEKLFSIIPDKTIQTDEMLLNAAAGRPNRWVQEAGGLAQLTVDSFRAAVAKGETLLGSTVKNWRWGDFHHLQPKHPIAEDVKALGWLLNPKRLRASGSFITLAVIDTAPWRMVCDLSDLAGNSWDVLVPGQQGHFLSRWYQDQSKMHIEGRLAPMHVHQQAFRNMAHLQLIP